MTAPDMDIAPEAREQAAYDLRQAAKAAADAIGELLRWSYMIEHEPDAAVKRMCAAVRSNSTNRNGVKAAAAGAALAILAPDRIADCDAKRQAADAERLEMDTHNTARQAALNALLLSGVVSDRYVLTNLYQCVREVCNAAVEFATSKKTFGRKERQAFQAWQAEHGLLVDQIKATKQDGTEAAAHLTGQDRATIAKFARDIGFGRQPTPTPKPSPVTDRAGNVLSVEFGDTP